MININISNASCSGFYRPNVRSTARLQPPPDHVGGRRPQWAAEPPSWRRGGWRQRRDSRRSATPPRQPAGVAVARHEPGNEEGTRPELDAHPQGRTGSRGIPAVSIQRGLSLRALRLQGAPDAFPLHAPGLRLQFL